MAGVVGPVWETGDYLALDRNLPEPRPRIEVEELIAMDRPAPWL